MRKIINILHIVLILDFICFFTFSPSVYAQVVINEFQLSPSDDQWIELFNAGNEEVDISNWVIDDSENGSSSVYTISGGALLPPNKCISFKSGKFDWNVASSDKVRLISPDGVEEYSYSSSPGDNVSIGRAIDGKGDLIVLGIQSKDAYNSTGENCLVNFPTPTPTLTPTPTPAAFKSVYKINKPKDGTSSELKSVQIYVDGVYIHHQDDEVLEFFNGHECYSGVDCSLGIHTVSLRKTGYLSWEDTQNFTAGLNMEVNPVLNRTGSSASTPTPAPAPTKTPIPKPTPTKTPKPAIFKTTNASQSASTVSAVLGLKVDDPGDSTTPLPVSEESKNKPAILPFVLILAGLGFIAIPIFSIIKNGKKDPETS